MLELGMMLNEANMFRTTEEMFDKMSIKEKREFMEFTDKMTEKVIQHIEEVLKRSEGIKNN